MVKWPLGSLTVISESASFLFLFIVVHLVPYHHKVCTVFTIVILYLRPDGAFLPILPDTYKVTWG